MFALIHFCLEELEDLQPPLLTQKSAGKRKRKDREVVEDSNTIDKYFDLGRSSSAKKKQNKVIIRSESLSDEFESSNDTENRSIKKKKNKVPNRSENLADDFGSSNDMENKCMNKKQKKVTDRFKNSSDGFESDDTENITINKEQNNITNRLEEPSDGLGSSSKDGENTSTNKKHNKVADRLAELSDGLGSSSKDVVNRSTEKHGLEKSSDECESSSATDNEIRNSNDDLISESLLKSVNDNASIHDTGVGTEDFNKFNDNSLFSGKNLNELSGPILDKDGSSSYCINSTIKAKLKSRLKKSKSNPAEVNTPKSKSTPAVANTPKSKSTNAVANTPKSKSTAASVNTPNFKSTNVVATTAKSKSTNAVTNMPKSPQVSSNVKESRNIETNSEKSRNIATNSEESRHITAISEESSDSFGTTSENSLGLTQKAKLMLSNFKYTDPNPKSKRTIGQKLPKTGITSENFVDSSNIRAVKNNLELPKKGGKSESFVDSSKSKRTFNQEFPKKGSKRENFVDSSNLKAATNDHLTGIPSATSNTLILLNSEVPVVRKSSSFKKLQGFAFIEKDEETESNISPMLCFQNSSDELIKDTDSNLATETRCVSEEMIDEDLLGIFDATPECAVTSSQILDVNAPILSTKEAPKRSTFQLKAKGEYFFIFLIFSLL